jgi:hypothetical protein
VPAAVEDATSWRELIGPARQIEACSTSKRPTREALKLSSIQFAVFRPDEPYGRSQRTGIGTLNLRPLAAACSSGPSVIALLPISTDSP